MDADTESLRDDLAFLRGLVQAGDQFQRPFALAYLAGGLIYFRRMERSFADAV